MKKLLALVLAFALIFAFAACGKKEEPKKDNSSVSDSDKNKTDKDVVEVLDCPNFIGLHIDDIKGNSEYTDNFEISEIWEGKSEVEQGIVFDQTPEKDQPLKKGTKVILYVSAGKPTEKTPDSIESDEPEDSSQSQILGLS